MSTPKRYTVRVKPNAKKNEVKEIDHATLEVRVTAPPVEGKANEKLIEVLAEHFGTPKRSVTIIRGASGRLKVIEVS